MSGAASVLGTPVDLGRARLRNRIVLLPHGLFFATWDRLVPTQRHLDYYRARAAGGAALVCTESSVVSGDGQQGAPLVLSSDAACVDGYVRIAEAVHAEGSLLSVQLTHYGNQASQGVTRAPLLGPSTLGDPALREPARAMTPEDMQRVTADFVAGARNLAAAGVDVVDLKVAHDGLLRQFLSPLCNDRKDEYGGSVANRMRYPLEVAAAVRDAVGDRVAVSVRLVLDEGLPGGYGIEDGVAFAAAFGSSALVDFVMADLGVWASMPMVVAPMSVPEGYAVPSIEVAARACGVPVVGFGRIHTPAVAERLVADGTVAAVGMARELIAEPDFARKVLSGEAGRVRPCTACNQQCVGNSMRSLPVSCTVNPLVGAGEVRRGRGGGAVAARRVVVVGGGPAGMESARLLAEDGHRVTLFEQGAELGGQLAVAARTGGRTGWRPYLEWLASELGRAGVDVRLSTAADAGAVASCRPEAVVLACGSDAQPPALAGVVTLDEYLRQPGSGGHVAFVDLGATGPALWSAVIEAWDRGAPSVSVVTPLPAAAGDLDGATFLGLYPEMVRRGTQLLTDHVASSVGPDGLRATNVYAGTVSVVRADSVVACGPRRPAGEGLDEPLRAATGAGLVARVGDATVPRDAAAAIRDAYRLAASLRGA